MADVPDLSSDEDYFEEEEWKEMETSPTSVTCLFCSELFACVEDALSHSNTAHNFDLGLLKTKFNMDCYSYIKLINYIKTHKLSSEVIMEANEALWEDERYLKPVDNESWLMFDFDSIPEKPSSPKTYHANVENGLVTLSQAHFTELQRTIHALTEQLKESQARFQMAKEDIGKMQASIKTIFEGGQNFDLSPDESSIIDSVQKLPLEDDEGYFNTYAHFGIQYEMLSDKVRTEGYRDAIMKNKEIMEDKVVLDLGCGTAILSMFCATAGAKKVFAVDQSDIIYQAMDIIQENNLQNIVKAVKGRLENITLEEKVDVIISEWMGYFLLFEGMLDSVIYARENWLKPGGLILPNKCNISLVANGDTETHKSFIEYWSDVYGFKMNSMRSEVVREASVDYVKAEHILSEPFVVTEIDLNTCTKECMKFTSKFKLPILKDGELTSFVGYFDTFFDLPNSVSFSTGPHCQPTHWKQTVFHYKETFYVKKGQVIEGEITCSRRKSDIRALYVQLDVLGRSRLFILG